MSSTNNIIAPAKMDYYPWIDVKVGDRHITFVRKDDATDEQMNTWLEHEDNYGDKHWTWRRFDKMVVVIKRQCSENICDCEDCEMCGELTCDRSVGCAVCEDCQAKGCGDEKCYSSTGTLCEVCQAEEDGQEEEDE